MQLCSLVHPGLAQPPQILQHLASGSRLPSPFRTSRHRASGRTGARARPRGDRAGGYWCVTGRSVGLSVHDQRCPACPDHAKADQSRPVPPSKSSAPPAARDAWRRRLCDPSGLAHSETAQAVRVRILVRVASSVTHQSLGNASDPKTPPSGASAKLPPLTFHHAKIALVHVTESRVPMHQVLHDWGGRRSKSCTRPASNLFFKSEHAYHNDGRGHG